MVHAVAGLHVLRGFVSLGERQTALEAALLLSRRAHAEAARLPGNGTLSSAHNVNSEERFKSIVLPLHELEEGAATCEHFERYASGHQLTYFRNRIPTFGVPALLDRFAALCVLMKIELSAALALKRSSLVSGRLCGAR
ncbi:MAG: hypothetical protein SGPRY_001571 [Prymnesium sp.]